MSAATRTNGDPVLEARELRFGYSHGQTVVEGVSGVLRAGRLLVVLGPNACGKTTLLKLMLGSLRAQSGEVRLLGEALERSSARRRASLMAYVPQQPAAVFAFTVRQVVEMGRFALDADVAALERALCECELEGEADRLFDELSCGQQQRVLLARALYQSSAAGRVLLLDEPVSAMDLYHVHRTMRVLRGLAARGLAVAVVLQDINLTARYADDVWLMDRGRVVVSGPWARVLVPEVLRDVYRVELVELAQESAAAPPCGSRPRFDVRWK
jgi:iron complex transport system ATP-binding protein